MTDHRSGPRSRAVLPRRWIALGVGIGAVVGAVLGLGAQAAVSSQRAVALVDLSSALAVNGESIPSTDQANRFVQSELLYLNSSTFQQQVGAVVNGGRPVRLTAAQVGNTDVVQIAAEAAAGRDAEHAADTAVSLYGDYRRTVVTQNVPGLQTQLALARRDLEEARNPSAPDLATLQDRVESLQSRIDRARTAAGSPGVGGLVVQAASASGAAPTASPTLAAGTGLALGAIAGLLAIVAPRLLSRRMWTADDALDLDVPVARPELPRAPTGWLDHLPQRRSDDPLESAARLLAARLAPQLAERRPLVLVGAAPGVGTSFTAVNLATALARRGRTVLVTVGDLADGQVAEWFSTAPDGSGLIQTARADSVSEVEAVLSKTPVDDLFLLTVPRTDRWEPAESALAGRAVPLLLGAGWTVVVDCPPATLSTAAFELAPLHPVTALVVAAGRTTESELTRAVEQLGAADRRPLTLLVNAARQAAATARPVGAGVP